LVPTFHPAAALRGSERVKGQMREDFELVREILDQATGESDAIATPDEQMGLFG